MPACATPRGMSSLVLKSKHSHWTWRRICFYQPALTKSTLCAISGGTRSCRAWRGRTMFGRPGRSGSATLSLCSSRLLGRSAACMVAWRQDRLGLEYSEYVYTAIQHRTANGSDCTPPAPRRTKGRVEDLCSISRKSLFRESIRQHDEHARPEKASQNTFVGRGKLFRLSRRGDLCCPHQPRRWSRWSSRWSRWSRRLLLLQ